MANGAESNVKKVRQITSAGVLILGIALVGMWAGSGQGGFGHDTVFDTYLAWGVTAIGASLWIVAAPKWLTILLRTTGVLAAVLAINFYDWYYGALFDTVVLIPGLFLGSLFLVIRLASNSKRASRN